MTSDGRFFTLQNTAAAVFVSGIGTGTFTIPTVEFYNHVIAAVGISYPYNGDIVDVLSSAFTTYDLSTPIGPTGGNPYINAGEEFATTAGLFKLTSVSEVTFQAVPEPSGLAFGCLGGLALVVRLIMRWPQRSNSGVA
jgi:hypothetical protein